MRKDYMPADDTAGLGETDFIASHWTRIWEQEGGAQGRGIIIRVQACAGGGRW